MGNSKGKQIKDFYSRLMYQNVEVGHDNLLGSFSVIKILGPNSEIFVLKVLDPRIYDEYTDIQEAVRKLNQEHPQISSFYFVQENKQNNEIYDLAFEYGEPMNTFVHEESILWLYIDQIIDGMIFLESQGYHYPTLSKQYIILTSKNNVKILNPYVFSDFMKEILQIYLNPQNPISNRRAYFLMQISRNIRELGIVVATLVSNCNEYQLKTDPAYVQKVIEAISSKFSKNLVIFLKTLISNQNQIKNFSELKSFVLKLKNQQSVDFNTSQTLLVNSLVTDPNASSNFQNKSSSSPIGKQGTPLMNEQKTTQIKPEFQTLPGINTGNVQKVDQQNPLQERKLKIFEDYPAPRQSNNPLINEQNPTLKDSTFEAQVQKKIPTIQSQQPFLTNQNPQNLIDSQLQATSFIVPVRNIPPNFQTVPSNSQLNVSNQNPGNNTLPTNMYLGGNELKNNSNPLIDTQKSYQRTSSAPVYPENQQINAQDDPPYARSFTQTAPQERLGQLINEKDAKVQNFGSKTRNEEMFHDPNYHEEGQKINLNDNIPSPGLNRRNSLNSEPIIHQNDKPNFLFVNSPEHQTVSLNSYLQQKDSGISNDGMKNVISNNNAGFGFFEIENLTVSPQKRLENENQKQKDCFFQNEIQTQKPSSQENIKQSIPTSSENEQKFIRLGQNLPNDKNNNNSEFKGFELQPVKQEQIDQKSAVSNNIIPTDAKNKQPEIQSTPSQQTANPTLNVQPINQSPISKQKLIAKVFIKWLSAEGRYQKIVEYEDKTTEEIPITDEEMAKFTNVQKPQTNPTPLIQPQSNLPQTNQISGNQQIPLPQNIQPFNFQTPKIVPQDVQQQVIRNPQNPVPTVNQQFQTQLKVNPPYVPLENIADKNSNVLTYNIPNGFNGESFMVNSNTFQNCLHFSLLPQGAENSILLFRSKPIFPANKFAECAAIVNRRDMLCPSMYHNVDNMISQNPGFNCQKETSLTNLNFIKKEEYSKPISMENLPRGDRQAIPTVLSNNARVIKKN